MSKFLKIVPYNLSLDSKELRNLIIENPDLPIVVLCDGDSMCYAYTYTYMKNMSCSIGEILDVEVPYSEYVECDRNNFNDEIGVWLWDKMCEKEFDGEGEPSKRYFQERLAQEKAKYAPFWKKVIMIKVWN